MSDETIYVVVGKEAEGGGHGYTGGNVTIVAAYRKHADARDHLRKLSKVANGWVKYSLTSVVLR